MKIRPLSIEGALEITPLLRRDVRGAFVELYRHDLLTEAIGHPLHLAQANMSVSAKGVVRGIHFADVPPGQAKYVTCTKGALLDVIVDTRVGSPTFGQWEAVRLDADEHLAVYVSEGLGHGFCALTEGATITYLVSSTYNPTAEHAVHALDRELAIDWQTATPILSERDAAAPSFATVRDTGLLPAYATCQEYTRSLRTT